jgi:hypothetical protein
MKRLVGFLTFLALTPYAFAQESPKTPLDKIQFELSSKQWVSTQKAIVSVNVNATLANADLVKARAEIMTRLNKIVKGDWQLVAFERSQDNSGLEKLQVRAQVRVDQSLLTDIYQQAKSVSLPGAQYGISGVEFKPGLEERQEVKAKIREQLYQQINDEIARINIRFPKQNYSVYRVIFVEGDQPVQPRAYHAKSLNMAEMAASAAPLSVSNELVLTAHVKAASNRKEN